MTLVDFSGKPRFTLPVRWYASGPRRRLFPGPATFESAVSLRSPQPQISQGEPASTAVVGSQQRDGERLAFSSHMKE